MTEEMQAVQRAIDAGERQIRAVEQQLQGLREKQQARLVELAHQKARLQYQQPKEERVSVAPVPGARLNCELQRLRGIIARSTLQLLDPAERMHVTAEDMRQSLEVLYGWMGSGQPKQG